MSVRTKSSLDSKHSRLRLNVQTLQVEFCDSTHNICLLNSATIDFSHFNWNSSCVKCQSRTGKTKHNASARELFLLLLTAALEDEAMLRCRFLGVTEWSRRIRRRPISYETLYWCHVWLLDHSFWLRAEGGLKSLPVRPRFTTILPGGIRRRKMFLPCTNLTLKSFPSSWHHYWTLVCMSFSPVFVCPNMYTVLTFLFHHFSLYFCPKLEKVSKNTWNCRMTELH